MLIVGVIKRLVLGTLTHELYVFATLALLPHRCARLNALKNV